MASPNGLPPLDEPLLGTCSTGFTAAEKPRRSTPFGETEATEGEAANAGEDAMADALGGEPSTADVGTAMGTATGTVGGTAAGKETPAAAADDGGDNGGADNDGADDGGDNAGENAGNACSVTLRSATEASST